MDYSQETQSGLEGRKEFPKKVEPEVRFGAEKECAKALEGGKHGSICALYKRLHCRQPLGPKQREKWGGGE